MPGNLGSPFCCPQTLRRGGKKGKKKEATKKKGASGVGPGKRKSIVRGAIITHTGG